MYKIAVTLITLACGLAWGQSKLTAADAAPLYQNDFEKATPGTVPDDMLVLDGAFAVTNAPDGNKVLELPGSPLETYGLLFGPTGQNGFSVQARILSTGKGRRFPVFGVGLNGVAGYRLRISPGKKALEISKG